MADEVEKGKAGRPSKFNEDRAEKLLTAVRGGNYLETAARFAGISYPTLRRWINKADDPSAPPEYREFKEALEKARADAEVIALAKIQKAATEGAWQAAAWYLERSWPEKWGRRDTSRVELVGEGGGPVKVVAGMELDNASMAALAQRLAARQVEEHQEVYEAKVIEEYAAELGPGSSSNEDGWWEDEDGA